MISRRFLLLILLLGALTAGSAADAEFSGENAHKLLRHLSEVIGPRPMGSPAEIEALKFSAGKLRQYGCDTSYVMGIDRYNGGNTSSGVAVGIRRGPSGRIIVIGGHIDSSDPEIPGSNDDGSGCAVVLEAARQLCSADHHSTLVFCLFGGEEKGLVGSRHFVSAFDQIDSVDLMIQLDMADGRGPLDIDPDAHRSESAPRWLVGAAIEEYAKLGYTNLRYPTHFFSLNHAFRDGPGSDHESFLQKGIPAIAFISDVGYPVHTAQDNFENFDPSGLKRSGDIVMKLVGRFDMGIPSRSLERYWLYMIWDVPFFVPIWGLTLLAIIAIILTSYTMLRLRSADKKLGAGKKIRWSPIKIFLLSSIVASAGWFSPDLAGLIKNVRHPWLSDIGLYYLLSLCGALAGGWIAIRIGAKFKLSPSPYPYFRGSALILSAFLALGWYIDVKLAVEPSAALILIGGALLVRNPFFKMGLLALAPLGMLRLVFSEWSEIFFHEIARLHLPGAGPWLLANLAVIILGTVYITPFSLALASAARDSVRIGNLIKNIGRRRVLLLLGACFAGLMLLAVSSPTFNDLWKREVAVKQEFDLEKEFGKIYIESGEYLNGVRISAAGLDTVLNSGELSFDIGEPDGSGAQWVRIDRKIEKVEADSIIHFDIELSIEALYRPFTISVGYSIDGKELNAFDTPFQFRTTRKMEKQIYWYSFPEDSVIVPVKFSVASGDTVVEKIEIVFNRLAVPVEISGEMISTVPETKFISKRFYPE